MPAHKSVAVALITLIAVNSRTSFGENPPSIYQQIMRATVLIFNSDEKTKATGLLVDARRRLVATNHHVADSGTVMVFFAIPHDDNWHVFGDDDDYLDHSRLLLDKGFASTGKVIATDASADLTLLQLARVAPTAEPIRLADRGPSKDARLFAVGNSGPLFRYMTGMVETVGKHWWRYEDGQRVRADSISFVSNAAPGDSGGPVADAAGRLVGIVAGRDDDRRCWAIHVSELRRLLNTVRAHRVLSIKNASSAPITFQIRNTASQKPNWQKKRLQPGSAEVFSSTSAFGAQIRFDCSFSNGIQSRIYRLRHFTALYGLNVRPNRADDAREYEFRAGRGGIDLYGKGD